MDIFYQKISIILTTKDEPLSRDKFNEFNELLDKTKKLPAIQSVRDGNWYTHKHKFISRNIKSFEKRIIEFKNKNPEINVRVDYKKTVDIPYILDIKNFIFPTYVVIRYTLETDIDPDEFKSYLASSLSSEEFSESEFIGNNRFHRFKIRFKIKNKEIFERDFITFKENRKNIDIFEEYEKTTIKTYANFAILIGGILLWTARADDIVKQITQWIYGI